MISVENKVRRVEYIQTLNRYIDHKKQIVKLQFVL